MPRQEIRRDAGGRRSSPRRRRRRDRPNRRGRSAAPTLPPAGGRNRSRAPQAEAAEPVEAVTVDAAAAATMPPAAELRPEPAGAESRRFARGAVDEEPSRRRPAGRCAARALTLLVLLLAGAGLGIWAAPKLAPLLPSGMAPVADWLTPGRPEAEAEIGGAAGARSTGPRRASRRASPSCRRRRRRRADRRAVERRRGAALRRDRRAEGERRAARRPDDRRQRLGAARVGARRARRPSSRR